MPDHVSESIEQDFKAEQARLASGRSPRRALYQEILPDEPRAFPGKVMGIDRNVNMPKRFGLEPNPISRKFPGLLGRGRWGGIHIRHDEQAGQAIVPEIYAFMPERRASSLAVRQDHKVLVSVEPYAPPGKDPAWIITETTVR